jgi:hypothetical protein
VSASSTEIGRDLFAKLMIPGKIAGIMLPGAHMTTIAMITDNSIRTCMTRSPEQQKSQTGEAPCLTL